MIHQSATDFRNRSKNISTNDDISRPNQNMNPMNTIARVSAVMGMLLATGASTLSAQVTSPDKETVELSPFVVNSTKDTGYQASSTLAGTRLDTPLKELGASISVYTKDFLEDIGATNANELLIYVPGMDAGGPGGNYSGTTADALAPAVSVNNRENPQGATRSRGMGSPTPTRNFFNTAINIDSYNTERVTVLRGPNAALIGVSSPAGIVDSSLAEADLNRNKSTVSVRLDNNLGLRSILDLNRVLIKGKLAGRLIGLDSREEYNQRPAYQHKQRLYGAINYRPFSTTLIRANFETGQMKANQPIPILLQNSISKAWYDAGRPGFDWTFYDDPARNPLAASQVSTNFIPNYMNATVGNLIASYNHPNDPRPSSIFLNTFPSTTGTTANAIRAGTFHPTLNRDLATDGGRLTSTRNIQELPAAVYWVGSNVLPGQLPGLQPPGIKIQGFTDFEAFDWKNRMIDETALFRMNFRATNISLAQTAWRNRLGLELAFDTQRQYNRARAMFLNGSGNAQTQVRVDTSVTLPDGTPNPNVGRPFLQANFFRVQKVYNDNESLRATAYLKYDFNDLKTSWGKWLGRHTLSGVAERYRADDIALVNRVRFDGPGVRNTVANINAANTILNVYVGPSLIGNNNPIKLEPIQINPIKTDGSRYGDISTFIRAANATDPGAYALSPVSIVEVVQPGTATREVIKSQAFTLQSNWLDGLVSTVLGWRKDVDYSDGGFSVGFPGNPTSTGPFDPGKSEWDFSDFDHPYNPSEIDRKESRSVSVVLNWPRKLLRLPAGADVSVFFNQSENFTPSGRRTDQFGAGLPSPKGQTKEVGLNLSFLHDKFVLRGSRYETSNQYLQYQGTSASGGPRSLITALANWHREANTNPQLAASRAVDIAKVVKFLPPGMLDIYQFQVSGTAPNIEVTALAAPPTGGADTSDLTAKGVEVELVYNPTSNWRILANVAKQETVRSNILPVLRKYAGEVAPLLAELADRPFVNYPVGHQLGQPLPANIQTVRQYYEQNLHTPMAADLATEGVASPEQRKWRVNLVTNYRFTRSGNLKGFSIGGGIRWQSKFAMGFPSSRLPNTAAIYDIKHPYYAPADLNVDASIGYSRKIWSDRIDWKIQLNGTNLYKDRDLIPVTAQPWGQVAIMRLSPERRFYLTNTFSF
jgi:outer membrane receptor protein involved in Fe transport